ncbi:MAG: DEAD/DEAH box helicase family protein [Bacteroidota bacterium]
MPTPEQEARQHIDKLLQASGWEVQDFKKVNLSANLGVAVREYPTESGPADYLLFVDRKPIGVIEAKPVGTTLSGVAEQSQRYLASRLKYIKIDNLSLRFGYESTGIETFFRDLNDPNPRSRRVFAFHKPETLLEWTQQEKTLRARLKEMPLPVLGDLRDCGIEAIKNLEKSFAEDKPRALIQMATGSGKTRTSVAFTYRLIKHAHARRVLFLVDRNNLGRQTKNEFQQYITPDDGRKLTELYNVQHLTSNTIDTINRVCITTIQRLYSMLKGEPDLDPILEEQSFFDLRETEGQQRDVEYNPNIPIEMFDVIITDECHRSIYNLWRQVLEYFDAYIIGLTATPSKQTLGFFNQNLVIEYSHENAVADGVNVGFDVYRIKTEITERGSKIETGFYVDKRNKQTRAVRWEQLDADFEYVASQLDRDVVSKDQIRTVIRTFKEKLFTDIFPGRTKVPKTLIFAKDDSHAEDIVGIVKEEFGEGNDFCKKITYQSIKSGEKPEDLLASFRNSYYPRIAVSVDMIATGTDIRPLECLLFMRDIKSRVYFEQMKGRGTRTIDPTDLQVVTPDATSKTHFMIVDAIGVCESEKNDMRPLERKPTVPFDKLLLSVALGNTDEDTLSSLAGRLARLERETKDEDKKEIQTIAKGTTIKQMIHRLLDAVDPDKQMERAKETFKTDAPTPAQTKKAAEELAASARSLFDDAKLRDILIEMKRRNEQTIDTVSKDAILSAGFDAQAKEKAKTIVESFKKFIEENKDEITALQILYGKPYGQRHLTYEDIKQVADAIRKPPYQLTPELLWHAYEQLEKAKVRGAGATKLLTNMISLIRFAVGQAQVLEPFDETVEEKFKRWISKQEDLGREFTPLQMEWLRMMKDHIATSLEITSDVFELDPFYAHGGEIKARMLFGENLNKIMNELNEVLV